MAIINFNIQSTLCFKIYRKFSVGVWCGTAMIQVCLKYKNVCYYLIGITLLRLPDLKEG